MLTVWKFPLSHSNVWTDMTHTCLHCDQEYCCDIGQPGRGNCKESQSRWGKSVHEDTCLSEITRMFHVISILC